MRRKEERRADGRIGIGRFTRREYKDPVLASGGEERNAHRLQTAALGTSGNRRSTKKAMAKRRLQSHVAGMMKTGECTIREQGRLRYGETDKD